MTAEEKIKVFASVKDLMNEMTCDCSSNDFLKNRYAVRFIMLDNFQIFRELSDEFEKAQVNTFGLESLLTDEDRDRWITQDELKACIKQIKDSTIVSPLSEVVRFYQEDKFTAFFNEIALLENTQDNMLRRIYIPLIGLESRFVNFLSSFGRIEESAPIWSVKTNEPQSVKIYLTPEKDNISRYEIPRRYRGLESMYDWLLFWKTTAPTESIVCSSLPINVNFQYSKPDNIFTIVELKTAFEFITQYLKMSMPTKIRYNENDDRFWNQFLSLLEGENNNRFLFESFANKYFNVHKLTIKDVLNKWTSSESSEFDRWLLKHYYLEHLADENHPYLTQIMSSCADYSPLSLFCKTALSIFEDTSLQNRAEERYELLRWFLPQYELPKSDLEKIEIQIKDIAKSDTQKAFALCSGRFAFEKILFIGWYKEGKLTMEALQKVYPDFVAYMQDARLDGWYNDYIQAYKIAKVEDKYTEEIAAWINDKNANEASFYEWYNNTTGLKSSKEWLVDENADIVYWVDGLGIEYLALIQEIIRESNFEIEKLEIAKTDLPSSTEHNKFENVTKIEDLDKYIHNNKYSHPQSICKEIEVIKDIFSKILNQSNKITIVIVSDHGSTALSRLVESRKYEAKASHEGRYIEVGTEESREDTDYLRHKNGDDWFKVALTHASLNKKPQHETHGGCTPEEILVPFLVISNKHKAVAPPKNAKVEVDKAVPQTAPEKPMEFEENELF